MLDMLGYTSFEKFIGDTIPPDIISPQSLSLPAAQNEREMLLSLTEIADRNSAALSLIGMGYYNCITPPVIQRQILENPGWYTAYTPYQSEISQGRLQMLMTFQKMVQDLTLMPLANASLLDEATAAAEAMAMCWRIHRQKQKHFMLSAHCHPQTIAVIRTRAYHYGIEVHLFSDLAELTARNDYFAALLQYPQSDGAIPNGRKFVRYVHQKNALAIVATDLLALALLEAPGVWGTDVVVGSSQRFGMPMGAGGPHAAFFATLDIFKRQIPGRIIAAAPDCHGQNGLRMALQTREQHIRREKASSNICTAQTLPAVIAASFTLWHGGTGIRRIATHVHTLTHQLAQGLRQCGYPPTNETYFDTVAIEAADAPMRHERAVSAGYNLRHLSDNAIGISLDECCTIQDVKNILAIFDGTLPSSPRRSSHALPNVYRRTTSYLTHPDFCQEYSETDFIRHLKKLEDKDISLNRSMIALGSCTMKLNACAEMMPISWHKFSALHPFAPPSQQEGYYQLCSELEQYLAEITGFAAVSLQPNAGSQGEYAGLIAIKAYHHERGEKRDICFIPNSAHGTNPASAVMAGLEVKNVPCDEHGNIDIDRLRVQCEQYAQRLAGIMVTYPSTHGVFEPQIQQLCELIHHYGGLVYLDGANLNAMVGIVRPAQFGADVMHINLHKTFCIPHGGGGPGMGPIAVTEKLVPFLPPHPLQARSTGAISAAHWGSASILPIVWAYIRLMGGDGLTLASACAILNANYMAHHLSEHYPLLYSNSSGCVAHECIIDLRPYKATSDITVEDIAKRLIDYGFHAPTISFPVAGTMMIEPTESESLPELNRFCHAMIEIKKEIDTIADGRWNRHDNPLKNAPHTLAQVTADEWNHAYSRQQAAFPLEHHNKYWAPVGRIDNVRGDKAFLHGFIEKL